MPDEFGNPTPEEIRQFGLPTTVTAPRGMTDQEKSQLLFSARPGASKLQKRVAGRISLDRTLRGQRFDEKIKAGGYNMRVAGEQAAAAGGIERRADLESQKRQQEAAGIQYVNGDLNIQLHSKLAVPEWEAGRQSAINVFRKVNRKGEKSDRVRNINYKLAYIHDAVLASEENRGMGLPQALGGSGSGIFDQGITEEMFVKEAKAQGFDKYGGEADDTFLTMWFRLAQAKAYGKKMDTFGSGNVSGFVGPGHKWASKQKWHQASALPGGGIKIPAYGTLQKTEGHIPESRWNQPSKWSGRGKAAANAAYPMALGPVLGPIVSNVTTGKNPGRSRGRDE